MAVTKAELPEAVDVSCYFQESLDCPVLLISAVTGQNLNVLIQTIWEILQTVPKPDPSTPPSIIVSHADETDLSRTSIDGIDHDELSAEAFEVEEEP